MSIGCLRHYVGGDPIVAQWLAYTFKGLDVLITGSGCLKQCEDGPIMIVYPEAWWYGHVDSEEKVDEILDALENGEPCEGLLL